MKNRVATILILALIALPGLASAQGTIVKAQVPFDFIVNDKTIHAGTCTVENIGRHGLPILVISNASESVLIGAARNPSWKAPEKPVLVFHRYGDRYFLATVREESQDYELLPSEAEREMRAQMVAESSVTLAADVR